VSAPRQAQTPEASPDFRSGTEFSLPCEQRAMPVPACFCFFSGGRPGLGGSSVSAISIWQDLTVAYAREPGRTRNGIVY